MPCNAVFHFLTFFCVSFFANARAMVAHQHVKRVSMAIKLFFPHRGCMQESSHTNQGRSFFVLLLSVFFFFFLKCNVCVIFSRCCCCCIIGMIIIKVFYSAFLPFDAQSSSLFVVFLFGKSFLLMLMNSFGCCGVVLLAEQADEMPQR